jgi:hypothetical protein
VAATVAGVARAFIDAKARRPDFLFVLFSGHGTPLSICLFDDICDHAMLASWILGVGCNKAALVVDACHAASVAPSYGFSGIGAPLDEPWSALYTDMVPGVRLLLSSRADQSSSDGAGRNGLFTAAFLDGLRRLPGNLLAEGRKYITAEAAISYATAVVSCKTGGRQTPQSFGETADFPIARPMVALSSKGSPTQRATSRSSGDLGFWSLLGTLAVGALAGYGLAHLPTYDPKVGRYRRTNGQFF